MWSFGPHFCVPIPIVGSGLIIKPKTVVNKGCKVPQSFVKKTNLFFYFEPTLTKNWSRIFLFLSTAVHAILSVLVTFSLLFFLYLFLGIPWYQPAFGMSKHRKKETKKGDCFPKRDNCKILDYILDSPQTEKTYTQKGSD